MKKITFDTFVSINESFGTQLKEFDVGYRVWKHKFP